MVMCGEWVCDNEGKWDFVLDKRHMARLVPLYEGMSLRELQGNVLREFGIEEGLFVAVLSYWPPSSLELATGIKTPPVLLTSDEALRYFLQHLRVKGGMNLFVRFERSSTENDFVDDSGMGFVTPATCKPKGSSKLSSCATRKTQTFVWPATSKLSSYSTQKKAPFVTPESCKPKVSSGSSSHCIGTTEGPRDARKEAPEETPNARVVNLEEVEFVREVERVEEVINCGSAFRQEEVLSGSNVGEDAVDDRDVRPRGYDKEFWSPLLKDDFWGSNAVNVIYNEDEIVEDLIKNSGGRSNVKTGPGDDEHPWMGTNNYNPWTGVESSGPSVDRMPRVSTRKLEEVDDEEFDIPSLFDDTSYAAAEIPDLDLEEGDGKIYVGKVFGNKEDCQISLAIYAIRNQFRFKQTRTKVDSFVVECPDPRCDWRVTAHEIRGCGYYEIRKAQLDHSCPIEFRHGYKSKATARVIAAV